MDAQAKMGLCNMDLSAVKLLKVWGIGRGGDGSVITMDRYSCANFIFISSPNYVSSSSLIFF